MDRRAAVVVIKILQWTKTVYVSLASLSRFLQYTFENSFTSFWNNFWYSCWSGKNGIGDLVVVFRCYDIKEGLLLWLMVESLILIF